MSYVTLGCMNIHNNTNRCVKLVIIGLGHWMVSPVYFLSVKLLLIYISQDFKILLVLSDSSQR